MAEKYQVRIRNKSITEWGRWHACFAGTRADGLPRYRPSPVSQICNQTTTECLPSLQTHPIFTRTEKEQQQQSVDSSISFSSRFFFPEQKSKRTKSSSSRSTHPTAIVRLHFGLLLLLKTPNPICQWFQFWLLFNFNSGVSFFYLAYQFDDRFAGNGNGKRKFTSPFFY